MGGSNWLLTMAVCLATIDASAAIDGSLKNIFGENNRKLMKSSYRVWSRIGRLTNPKGGACTGSLIGTRLIISAAHCFIKEGEFVEGDYRFFAGKSESLIEKVWWGGTTFQDRSRDWAIASLKKPLGKKLGYFGWLNELSPSNPLNEQVVLAGFGGQFYFGEQLSYDDQCRVRQHMENNTVLHDCDSSRGDSGAPIFICSDKLGCVIVALHVAAFRDDSTRSIEVPDYESEHANIAINVRKISAKMKELREQTEENSNF